MEGLGQYPDSKSPVLLTLGVFFISVRRFINDMFIQASLRVLKDLHQNIRVAYRHEGLNATGKGFDLGWGSHTRTGVRP